MSTENPSIYSDISTNAILQDKRLGRYGLIFGNVTQLAKQYGVTIETEKGILKFTAPKNRLQIFAEKLHFSGVNYWD